jgi:hypothetical protein
MVHSISRLDRIIAELEKLQSEANEIYDAHVDVLMCDLPGGVSFGVTKMRAIVEPAGLTINHVKALKLLRSKFLQQPT